MLGSIRRGSAVGFDSAVVRLQHITDWVDHTDLQLDYCDPDPDAPFATARVTIVQRSRQAGGYGD